MAFSATYIEIALRYLVLGQQCQTARVYSWDGAAIATATAVALAEGWWNHYKDAWRALASDNTDEARFLSVFVREVGGGFTYGEFAIPSGEQAGTRTDGEGSPAPSYQAVGTRLTVGTSVTRPGQMRIPFLFDGDTEGNAVNGTFLDLCEPLAQLYSEPNILGAPVATGVIQPCVVRYGVDNNTVVAGQEIVGYILNPFVTSQVSRRVGHGT